MGKKNLDKLFQEKLKDFSEAPNDKVWKSIEASLDQKKKSRRILPIWWKLGGVAAVLLIALLLLNLFEEISTNTPVVTNVDLKTESASEENNTEKKLELKNSKEAQIVDVQEETSPIRQDTSIEQIVSTEGLESTSVLIKSSKKEQVKNQNSIEVQMASSNQNNVRNITQENEAASSEKIFDNVSQQKEMVESGAPKTELEKKVQEVVNNSNENRLAEEDLAQNKEKAISEIIDEDAKKKSIFDEISEQEQEEVITENTGSKWSAGPSIAPVYYNAMGEGSPVHSIFVSNSKSGDINLSYGLSIAYEVSKKLSIRSGIHKVDYGYRTNEVGFSSSLETTANGQIDNIDYTLASKNLVVNSNAGTGIESSNQNLFLDATSSDVSATSSARDGTMEQQFGYLEVPVELNYALLNKRFGINLIGGVSSLFLIDNSISLSSGELTTEVGEANNVNSVNFSTNVGFGLNYKVTPKVQLNVEPVFKYQLNTFSKTDGTFNPFSVGVYSGLSFKF